MDFNLLKILRMNNRRFQLEDEIENQDNRNRMGLGFFFIIMLAFPMQYYLANNMGQGYSY